MQRILSYMYISQYMLCKSRFTILLTLYRKVKIVNNIQIPFDLFIDLTDYFFTDNKSELPPDLETRIKEQLRLKCQKVLRREEYADMLKKRNGGSSNG